MNNTGESKPLNDRRRQRRVRVRDASGSFALRSKVRIKDISLTGMAFETHDRPNVGHDYTMRLRVAERVFTIEGRVVWCHLTTTQVDDDGEIVALYRAGMRFQPLEIRDAEDLRDLLQRDGELLPKLGQEAPTLEPAALARS